MWQSHDFQNQCFQLLWFFKEEILGSLIMIILRLTEISDCQDQEKEFAKFALCFGKSVTVPSIDINTNRTSVARSIHQNYFQAPHLATLIFNTKGRKRGISISGNFVFWHTSRVVSRPSIFLGKIIIILHDVIMVDDVVVRFTSYVVNLQRTSFRRRELRKRYANRRTSEDGTLVARARAENGEGKVPRDTPPLPSMLLLSFAYTFVQLLLLLRPSIRTAHAVDLMSFCIIF